MTLSSSVMYLLVQLAASFFLYSMIEAFLSLSWFSLIFAYVLSESQLLTLGLPARCGGAELEPCPEAAHHLKNALGADLQKFILFIGLHFLPCLINEMAHAHRRDLKTVDITRQPLLDCVCVCVCVFSIWKQEMISFYISVSPPASSPSWNEMKRTGDGMRGRVTGESREAELDKYEKTKWNENK